MYTRFPNFIQTDSRDCGPVCLQIIVQYYGKYLSLEDIKEKVEISKNGVSVFSLCQAAETIGLRAVPVKASYKDLLEKVPLPVIAHWNDRHFIVIYKITAEKVFVSDPSIGLVTFSRRDFLRSWLEKRKGNRWRNGVIIALEPTDAFKEVVSSKKPSFIYVINYLFSYLTAYRKPVIQLILVMIGSSMVMAAFPIITRSIVDVGISAKDMNFITLLLIANLVLIISVSISTFVRQSINMHIASRIKVSLLSDYISKLLKLPITYFESKLKGDLFQRTLDYEKLNNFITNSMFGIVMSGLNILIFGIILYSYNPNIYVIFLSGSLLYIIWTLLFWNIRKKMDIKYFSLQAQNNSQWMEMFENIQDIKINNYETGRRWKREKLQVRLHNTGIKLLNVTQLETIGGNFIVTVKDMALTFYAASLVIEGKATFGMLIAIQFILGQLKAPLQEVVRFITSYQIAFISFVRMHDVNLIDAEHESNQTNDFPSLVPQEIALKNIGFRYNNSPSVILKNISLTIDIGQTVAIVGSSGSGKTTLMKILMRLYTPSFGEMYLGGYHSNIMSLKIWRDNIGVVRYPPDKHRL